jgi:hypothetical protein
MLRASVMHLHDRAEEFQQLLCWYEVRDILLGRNETLQDIRKALELAALCDHPDAVWLTKVFAGREVFSREEAKEVFLACDDDPRALCFGAVVSWPEDVLRLRKAAADGYAYAQARMAQFESKYMWAEKAAAQGERLGFYVLGRCFELGLGCEKDLERAKDLYLVAAEFEDVFAVSELGELREQSDPLRFEWLGKAAIRGCPYLFFAEFVEQLNKFNSSSAQNACVVFVIGRMLSGHVDLEKREIFSTKFDFDRRIIPARQAIAFYEFELKSYRKSVNVWSLVAIRKSVVKDIRILIAKLIWDSRREAKYKL